MKKISRPFCLTRISDQPSTNETDEELLLAMSEFKSDPNIAKTAWGEFYLRHIVYAYYICHRVCSSYLDRNTLQSLATEVLAKAYKAASSYRFSNLDDPTIIRRRVRAWLGAIAHNTVKDFFRAPQNDKDEDGEPKEIVVCNPDEYRPDEEQKESSLSKNTLIVREVMETVLNKKERAVLLTTYQYYKVGEEHNRLPNDVVKDLAEYLGTTTANLTAIRQRATKKMKQALTEKGFEIYKS